MAISLRSLFIATLLAVPTGLVAQELEPVTQAEDDAFDLGTIILTTARRTEEDVTDVPASVQVLSGATLERSNVDDFNQAVQQLPNVNVGIPRDPRSGEISIRGISSLNIAATAPTVGVFQDGILQNPTGLRFNNTPDLVDLERVEIVYGPQGTSYGRGTIGGAVNFVTAKPVFEREARVSLSYSDLNEGNAEFVLNTPLSDTLALRAVIYGDTEEGFVDTPFAPSSSLGTDNLGTRISLRYQPSDRLTIDGTVQFDHSSYDAPLYTTLQNAQAGVFVSNVNQVPGNEIDRLNLFFEVGYEFEAGLLTSTTGYLDSHLTGVEDFDFSAVNGSLLGRSNEVRSFSQEVRFESRDFDVGQGTLSFNVGANYSDTSSATLTNFQVTLPAPGQSRVFNSQDVQNYGVFGDLRWRPVEPLEITVGGRYSEDRIVDESVALATGSIAFFASPFVRQSATYSAFTPNISVLYDWSDQVATYATVSTGYRPGGFTTRLTPAGPFNLPFSEEEAINYEVGLKSNFFDGALAVNASLFLIDYEDIQVPIPGVLGGGIANAASALSEGAELSIIAQPLPGLTINGAFGYTNARFLDYNAPGLGQIAGQSLPNAPEFTYGVSADYEFSTRLGQFTPFVRGEVNGTSSFVNDAGSVNQVGDYHLVNLRAGLRGETASVTFFVENLFDEDYVLETFTPFPLTPPFTPVPLGVPGEPRKFGFIATMNF